MARNITQRDLRETAVEGPGTTLYTLRIKTFRTGTVTVQINAWELSLLAEQAAKALRAHRDEAGRRAANCASGVHTAINGAAS